MSEVFNVQGMTCGHCERAVTKAIKQVDAEAQVTIDRPQGLVTVDSQAARAAIQQAITEEGYTVA